jgi:DegV family protein with EDD domain
MAIKIITDSTSDLPADLAEKANIRVVPLYINFMGDGNQIQSLRDGIDVDPDEFYHRLGQESKLPTTSQPSVQDFTEVYQEYLENGDQIISIHVSSKLSGTWNSATQAHEQLDGNPNLVIIDSGLVSMGMGMAVLAGAQALNNGKSFEEIQEVIHAACSKLKLFCMVDTLEYLQKGGRLGKGAAFLGSLLSLKPILALTDGEIQPFERVRTRRKALDRLGSIGEEFSKIDEACILYTTTPEDAEELKTRISRLIPSDKIITTRLGPVVGTHVGPGAIGLIVRLSE